ncbi:hypothetical protein [Amycolatopsis sp. H20-H5]|uniref:hypothetical protein n=1 Tax=Amycolatopsis sp. H20-H5 TaxID=3046309 RepID=UPI002DB9AC00|nr:hypothetical protein [Amycolatopsis sp. H20-H5]MEC3979029.1 hypothetical protein [Amycolatopsis sp. H20-H5]
MKSLMRAGPPVAMAARQALTGTHRLTAVPRGETRTVDRSGAPARRCVLLDQLRVGDPTGQPVSLSATVGGARPDLVRDEQTPGAQLFPA